MRIVKKSDDFEKVLAKALNFLSYRSRSTQEVINRLDLYTRSSVVKEQVITYLTEHKLLDDYLFAENWVNYRQNKYPMQRLISELKDKGVEAKIVQEVLANIKNDKVLITKIIIKKLKADLPLKDQKLKLTRYLLSKGFTYQDIKDTFYELSQRMLN